MIPAHLLILSRRLLLGFAFFLFACLPPNSSQAQGALPQEPEALTRYQELARKLISGERAREQVGTMDPSYRVPGNEAYTRAIHGVVRSLEAHGYVDEELAGSEALTYRIETREMGRPAWDPIHASLQIVGQPNPLMTLSGNINLMAAYSHSTPGGGVEGELVDVGRGSPQDFEGKDVKGKIVLGDGNPGQLFRRAVQEHGALGVLAFRLSSFNRPDVNRDIAVMSSIPYDADAEAWGLAISGNARDALREALDDGPVRVRVEVESHIYPSEELTLVAEVRGDEVPDERFVFSAHVQESGANDNATGVASLTEIAILLGEGRRSGSFVPARTISMVWGDEISSTRRFLEDDTVRASKVIWGLSLDMVGEDTERTGGTFLIEKMPDPSAVWTRGEDRHTEWGGRPMTLEQMTPHYFNDFALNRCMDQGEDNGWVVKTNPYEGGSDHVPFLRADIPGLLFWHFTDQYYHTDGDRLEMVSAETLKNVSICAAVTAMALTTADSEMLNYAAQELAEAAIGRLETEAALGRAALAEGGDLKEEQLILQSWADWYLAAVDTMRDMEAGGVSAETERILTAVRETVAEAEKAALGSLGR